MAGRVSTFKAYTQIRRQPDELQRLLQARVPVEAAAELLADAPRVHTVGTGTSYNAALLAAHWLRAVSVEAAAWGAFDFVAYGPELRAGDVALVYSHTGRKHFSRAALEHARAAGVPAIWVVAQNPDADNPATVRLQTVARETSPMFTLSHTGALLVTARVVERLCPGALGLLEAIPAAVRAALDTEAACAALARAWRDRGGILIAGAGPHRASALEAAIKLNEGPRMRACGYAVEQFLHGPQAQVQGDDAMVLFAAPGPGLERTRTLAGFARDVGLPVAWIGPGDAPAGAEHLATADLGEALAPIVQAVPGQLLAACLAAERGVDCDAFRRDEPAFARAYERYAL